MNDQIKRSTFTEYPIDILAIANIYVKVTLSVRWNVFQTKEDPARVSLWTEEIGPHIVIDTGYRMFGFAKVAGKFRTDKSTRAANQYFYRHK